VPQSIHSNTSKYKEVKTMNLKGSSKLEDESSSPPSQHQTAHQSAHTGKQLQQLGGLLALILPTVPI
jgi:hypothetical protein